LLLQFQVLPNGAAVVVDPVSTARSVAVGLFWQVGSRDERRPEWGAAHFLEHLTFKGAGRWDGEGIAREMDRLGGEINAFTTRDLTCYHAHLLADDLPAGFDLVWTLTTEPWLNAADLEVERGVVREELREAYDDPADRVEQAYWGGLFGRHPVAREVLGSEPSIRRITVETIRRFWADWYRPSTLTVVVAGRVAPAASAAIVERVGAFRPQTAAARLRGPAPEPVGGEVLARVPGDQVQVMVGWPAPPWDAPAALAARCLATAFGGQNSSRLWQRVREQEGLAYHVGAAYQAHWDTADLSMQAAVSAEHLSRVLDVMGEEWGRLRDHPLSEDEVARARRQLETTFVFSLETPEGRMHWLARWAMARRPPPPVARTLAAIRRVTRADVMAMVEEMNAAAARSVVAVAGPRRALGAGFREQFWRAATR
jgi:predicted Zn-dependent peptidase